MMFKKEKSVEGYIIRLYFPEYCRDFCIFSDSLLKMRLEDFEGNIIEEDFYDEDKLRKWRIEFPNSVIIQDFDFGYCKEPISIHLLGRLKIIEEIE